MSHEEFEEKKLKFLASLKLSMHEINELQSRTVEQSNCEEWKKERSKRLTASNVGKICKLRKTTSREKSVISIIYQSNFFHGTSATRYGIQFEPIARQEFEKLYACNVRLAGLFVDLNLPYLAASPDGLIGDDSIIEIKCPISIKDLTPKNAYNEKKLSFMEVQLDNLILKKTHIYYYQVQGQLHITNRTFCYFIVWTPKGICVDKIERDDTFWKNKMEVMLSEFYLNHMLPEIINPQLNMTKISWVSARNSVSLRMLMGSGLSISARSNVSSWMILFMSLYEKRGNVIASGDEWASLAALSVCSFPNILAANLAVCSFHRTARDGIPAMFRMLLMGLERKVAMERRIPAL
ncbi:hypothetical protein QTP88_012458 [Uroleucon formosanum]